MAGNIKGITIEFDGNTSRLDKALKDVKNSSKDIDKSLKDVNNALKFNPKNVDLLKQKQELLKQKVEKTREQLQKLNDIQKQMDAAGVDKTSAEYMELKRNIVETESKLKHFNSELRRTSAEASKLGRVSRAIKDVGGKFTAAGEAMRGVSIAGAAVVASMGAITYKAAQNSDELNTLSKVYGIGTDNLQMYALAADLVDVSVETLAKSQVKMKRNMLSAKESTGQAAKAFDSLGIKVTDSTGHLRDQESVFQETLAALGKMKNETERDALAMSIFGKSAAELNPLIEDAGETYKMVADIFAKNGLELINQETINKANQFNDEIDKIKATASLAAQTIGMKMAGYLLPVMENVSAGAQKLAGWLSKLSPTTLTIIAAIAGFIAILAPLLIFAGKIAFAISSITGLMATLGVSFAAIAGPVGIAIAFIAALIAIGVALYKNWDKVKSFASKLWVHIKKVFQGIFLASTLPMKAIIAVGKKLYENWGKIKAGASKLFSHIKKIFKAILTASMFPMLAVIAIGKKLYQNWDKIKAGASKLLGHIRKVFNGIKKAITEPIRIAVNFVKKMIEKIKSLFKFKVSLPKIKLPHFGITPPGWKFGDLLKGSIPKLGINWYKTGGIFNSPSVIGVGEAGSEAVLPLDKFWGSMDKLSDKIVSGITGSMSNQPIVIKIGNQTLTSVIVDILRKEVRRI